MLGVINIYSKSENDLARKLSNFYSHSFVFEGQNFQCFEAFLQCLKFSDPDEQLAVASMKAKEAKENGQTRNWQTSGYLYWKGQPVSRYAKEYRELLDRAYDALCENQVFAEALCRSRGKLLIHTIGKLRKRHTVLTSFEFCEILMQKRRKLLRNKKLN